jgi:hypothetical protein
MKCFKKPVRVMFEILTNDLTVETLEGKVSAGPGQVLMTGVRGEQYPMPIASFLRDYEYPLHFVGTCTKKMKIIEAVVLTSPTEVKVSWSGDTLKGKPGDYLVTYGDNDQAIVEKSIFEETYEVLS